MKRLLSVAMLAGCISVMGDAFSAPVLNDDVPVALTQDETSGRVTATYSLSGAPAIVTVEVLTNDVPVDASALGPMSGDVHRLITEAGNHAVYWKMPQWWMDRVGETNLKVRVSAWSPATPPDWMAVSLIDTNGYVRYYADELSIPGGVENSLYKTEQMLFRKIPAAKVRYRFGAPSGEKGKTSENGTPRIVTVNNDFYMGVYQVTQRQYELVTGDRPSFFSNVVDYAERPVEQISYKDVRGDGYEWPASLHEVAEESFMGILRRRTGVDGFDLPAEIEWEFAARAECASALYTGSELSGVQTSSSLNDIARYRKHNGYIDGSTEPDGKALSQNGTAKVGEHDSNKWRLFDMVGNVWEMCLDFYNADPTAAELEAGGPSSGNSHSARGGAWNSLSERCRCASRYYFGVATPNKGLGFRVAMPLPRVEEMN